MFGSSQDRARQLAARKRRERICSNDSQSSYRSISSSSQASQHLHTSLTMNQNIQRPSVISEHPSRGASLSHQSQHTSRESYPSQQFNYNTKYSPSAHDFSQCVSGRSQPQVEQQRLQAEYLSRVLYDNLAISSPTGLPQSQFKLPPQHSRYGSLEMQSIASFQLRNITAPLSQILSPTQHLSMLQTQLDTPTPPPPQKTVVEDHLWRQSAISLRGGGPIDTAPIPEHVTETKTSESGTSGTVPGNMENKSPDSLPSHYKHDLSIASRPFAREFPWVSRVFHLPEWHTPICSGASYNAFLDSLSRTKFSHFRIYFDMRLPASNLEDEGLAARRLFFRTLTSEQQAVFKNIINGRLNELLARSETVPGTKRITGFEVSKDPRKPQTCLLYLLEATEVSPVSTQASNPPSQISRPLPSSNTRCASAPLMGQLRVYPFLRHALYYAPSILR